MALDFSKFFHKHSKGYQWDIPQDPSLWPESWATIEHKRYPRFPTLTLETSDEFNDRELAQLLMKRESRRAFSTKTINNHELSVLLRYGAGVSPKNNCSAQGHRRVYPSAGALYPLELYPFVTRNGEGLPSGLYHYDVFNHQLETLPFADREIWHVALSNGQSFLSLSSLVIFLTAIFRRPQVKYGERGYRSVLLEAGHIGQNIYLVAEALALQCVAFHGNEVFDTLCEQFLGIDGNNESIVYALALGK